jgi:hypothetical protein
MGVHKAVQARLPYLSPVTVGHGLEPAIGGSGGATGPGQLGNVHHTDVCFTRHHQR